MPAARKASGSGSRPGSGGFEWEKKLTQKNRLEDIAKTFNNITEEDLLASVEYGGIPIQECHTQACRSIKKLNAQKNTRRVKRS